MSAPRTSRVALMVLATAATLSGSAAAKRLMVGTISRPPTSTPTAPAGRDVSAAKSVDVARLPEISLPPFLKQAEVRKLTGTDPTDLKVGEPRLPKVTRKAGSSVPISVDSPLPSSIIVGERALVGNVFASESASMFCDPLQSRSPIRWETFAIRADGAAEWTVTDGYLDASKCEVKQVSRHTFALQRLDGLGVPVHAARVAGGVVLFTPRTDQATGDTTAGAIGVVRSPVSRVFVPTQKGESAAVLLSVELGRLDAWLRSAGAPELSERPLRVTVRVDVSQTVSESAPTLFVRSSMTMPERPATPAVAAR